MSLFKIFKSASKTAIPESEASEPNAFDSEFAVPAPETLLQAANEAPLETRAGSEKLEEWSEPLPSVAPPILEVGARIEAESGALIIEEWLETRGGENVYRATWLLAGATSENVRLRHASGAPGEQLEREARWRAGWEESARLPMLPRVVSYFRRAESVYLATQIAAGGPTLGQFFARHEAEIAALSGEERAARETEFVGETLLFLVQVAAFLMRLHEAGFAHLGLRAEGIETGKPVQITDCAFAAPLGQPLELARSIPGYSAPELAKPGIVDARSDLYGVGALLYRALTGQDVPESGADFLDWKPRIVLAGAPQILARTLGDLDARFENASELHRALVRLKARLKPTISHAICGLSTIGLEPARATNQDSFGWIQGAWESESGPLAWSAFAVADGMGGMAAGEIASEIAVHTFLQAAASWTAATGAEAVAALSASQQEKLVKEWASLANGAVVHAMNERGARGGCTLDAGLILEKRLAIAHVGDGRFYLLRAGETELLSRDHSFVMSLLLQGQIGFDEIRAHAERNKVTRSLGERHPQPDYFIDTLQVQKSAPTLELRDGDVLLVCSDGLWEPVIESEMLAAIAEHDLSAAARQMLKLALQRGAPDNATLILLRLDEQAAPIFG